MNQGIPREVADFLTRHIGSVVQLEMLLLLRATAPKQWSAQELARELRIDPSWAESQSAELCTRGALECIEGEKPVYYYASSPGLNDVVSKLAATYADRRVTIISFIYSQPPDQLKLLADAFRIRKEKPDG